MLTMQVYSKENIERIKAKPYSERTYNEKLILQNVELAKIVAHIKAREGMA